MMGWMTQSWGMLLGNAAFVVVNARGYLKWGSGDKGMGTNGK